ncbi:hypothetical protein BDR26DRAFT_1013820 [Obelidium mucronatum]|nr:hypothetical protein BDR26DRAFT_1013820 [Obelidium mucronatum]
MSPQKKGKMAGPTKDELKAQLDAALKQVADMTSSTASHHNGGSAAPPTTAGKKSAKTLVKAMDILTSARKPQVGHQRLSFTESMEETLLSLCYTKYGKRFKGHKATNQCAVVWEYIAVDFNSLCAKELKAQNYGRVEKEQLQEKHDALKSDYSKAMEALVEETGNLSDYNDQEKDCHIWKDKDGKKWGYENLPANWELMVDCFGDKKGLGNNLYGQSKDQPRIVVKCKALAHLTRMMIVTMMMRITFPIANDTEDNSLDSQSNFPPSTTPAAKKRKQEFATQTMENYVTTVVDAVVVKQFTKTPA